MISLLNPTKIFPLIERIIFFINSIFFIILVIALTFALILSPPLVKSSYYGTYKLTYKFCESTQKFCKSTYKLCKRLLTGYILLKTPTAGHRRTPTQPAHLPHAICRQSSSWLLQWEGQAEAAAGRVQGRNNFPTFSEKCNLLKEAHVGKACEMHWKT